MTAIAAPPTKRPYQLATDAAILANFKGGAGQNRLLVKWPTGTGKTVWFAGLPTILEPWLKQFPSQERRMLVIAHREELLEQAVEKIQAQHPKAIVMIEQADRVASPYADIVVASIQTLAATRMRRLRRLLQRMKFRIVVVDECHHAAATSYRNALGLLGFLPMLEHDDDRLSVEAATFDDVKEMEAALRGWDAKAPKDRLLVGVTATPNRSDEIGLGCVFQTIAYSYNLKNAVADKWLVPIVPQVIETNTSLDNVKTTAGDFNQKQLAEAVNNTLRNQAALAGWREFGRGRSTICFTVDVAHAHTLAELFTSAGHRAQAISGETPKDDRRNYLRQYTDGQIDILMNCMVLTEGTDLPRTSCILHAKPTKSATLYEQMTGRGLRLFPGKHDCVVIDVVDVARRHSLQVAGVLYGLPPSLLAKGKTLDQIAQDVQALLEQMPGFDLENAGRLTLEQLQLKASTFDYFAVRELEDDFAVGRRCHWTRVGDHDYQMSYPWEDGKETIAVQRNILDHFDVVRTLKRKDDVSGIEEVRQATIAAQVDTAPHAARLAEHFVEMERRSALRLLDVNASWKLRPASEKQINYLRKLGVKVIPKGLTMGQAGALISQNQHRRYGGGRH